MASMKLSYNKTNECFVKSLGHWIAKDGGKRVPRYFLFPGDNTPVARREAEAKLLPLLARWQAIKTEAKKRGDKYPVWFRESVAKIKTPTVFDMANPAEPENPEDASELANIERSRTRAAKNTAVFRNLRTNVAANPAKPLFQATVDEAKQRYCDYYKVTGVKSLTSKSTGDRLKILATLDLSQQPMISFDAGMVVESLIAKVVEGKLRARTATNHAVAIKSFVEWYAKQVQEYQLPKDWKDLFSSRRFRNPVSRDDVFAEDAEELDFEVFSATDLKVLFDNCTTDRQRLYILLALQAGTYYVDLAHAIRSKNVHLDRPKPFLLYRREKESHHPDSIIQKVWLWPETVLLLKREMNRGVEYPQALLSREGKPMIADEPKDRWMRVSLRVERLKLLAHRKTIRFKDLRKTGGSAIANLSSTDLADLHLGHKVKGIGSKYIKLQKRRLYRPLMKWREQLANAGTFAWIK